MVEAAAGAGALDILKYLNANDEIFEDTAEWPRDVSWGGRDTMNAAGGGHSDVVKWLLTEVGEGRSGTKAMNYTMSAAVANGDVELVRWLQDEKGIPLPRCGAFYEAAAKGCLAMLQSYFTQAANGTGVLLRAAESGHLDIVRWVINREIEGGVCPKTNGEGANKTP